jgi:hypothetical protein
MEKFGPASLKKKTWRIWADFISMGFEEAAP